MKKTLENIGYKKQSYPMEYLQIDSHQLHVGTAVDAIVGGKHELLRSVRVHVLAAICPLTKCVIAHHTCQSDAPNQQDILELLNNIFKPWAARKLQTPGLKYTPGACLPTSLEEFPLNMVLGTILSDNAKSHMSESVIDFVCRGRGGALEYGYPGQPTHRHQVEQLFNDLKNNLEEAKSGTGTGPLDPRKESWKNAQKPPLLRLNWVEEMIDVIFTQINVTPMSNQMGKTPIEALKRELKSTVVPIADFAPSISSRPFSSTKEVTVCHDEKQRRFPHVYFSRIKYQGEMLIDPSLRGQKLIVEFDRRDIRSIKARTLDGVDLGVLYASKTWQRWPLSFFTAKIIRRLVDNKRLRMPDPMGGYFDYVASKRNEPKWATELVRINREFKLTPTEEAPLDNEEDFSGDIFSEPNDLTAPFGWNLNLVKNRRE